MKSEPMSKLKISEGLSLPVEAVTQAIGILAKRRAGKSYLARRFAEELYRADQQIVIVDPKGDWWGIRSSADGKAPGLPIVMFGGARGDVPLEPGGGALVAKVIVEERMSALLDLSSLRKHEVATFMAIFLEDLYRLKAREEFQTAMMLYIDEADAIAPQKPQPNEARMLGAASDIVRRGGQRGLGCTLVTQRSAVLSKDVLTQVEMLVTLRTIAPQDLAAVKAWIDVHGTVEEQKILMASLPSLPIGDAWFWSPGWPTDKGIFQRAHTLPITTFDSGATPKPGQKRIEPKRLAEVDLDAIRKQMAETIERAKADDPKELRKEIERLRHELKMEAVARTNDQEPKRVEVPVFDRDEFLMLKHRVYELIEGFRGELDRVETAVDSELKVYMGKMSDRAKEAKIVHRDIKPLNGKAAPVPRPVPSGSGEPAPELAGQSGLRRIMVALAQNPQGLTKRKLALLSGLTVAGGSFRTYLGKARTMGWVASSGELQKATGEGLAALGAFEPLPTGPELLDYWIGEVGRESGAGRMLRVLFDAYPQDLDHDELAEATGMERGGGSYRTYLGKLRTLELVERKALRASPELFD